MSCANQSLFKGVDTEIGVSLRRCLLSRLPNLQLETVFCNQATPVRNAGVGENSVELIPGASRTLRCSVFA
ncbi:MAG: hypothetical protein H7315_01960 [Herminiimonas sp.]|nr:hypothetical protein [Herminiimonas sp.]